MRVSVYYIAALVVLPWMISGRLLSVEAQSDQETLVHVSAEKELSDSWRITKASLRETFSGTTGELEIQNGSANNLSDAMFYAEYFDDTGRFCFSLVFSQDKKGEEGPMSPGETRQLYSTNSGLEPAVRPTDVRVHLVRQRPGEGHSIQEWPAAMQAPVTVSGNLPADDTKLRLFPDISFSGSPVVDVLLARVAVDEKGVVTGVQILNFADNDVKDWFDRVVPELGFYPATSSGTPKAGDALFLVRAVREPNSVGEFASEVAKSPWVKAYVSNASASEVPPVTQLLLHQPPTRVKLMGNTASSERPPAPPGVLEALIFGSEWSSPAVVLTKDPSMPWHLRRQLAPPDLLLQ